MVEKKVDIIIISYKSVDLTIKCINSILDTPSKLIDKIIVVDNASNDGSAEILEKKFDSIILIKNKVNYGYAKAINTGAKKSTNKYFIVTNNDVEFRKNSIASLLETLENNASYGVAGPQQVYPDGSWQYSYGDLPGYCFGIKKLLLINHIQEKFRKKVFSHDNNINKPKKVSYIDGAVMAIRRSAYEDIGGFDEDYFFFSEEADFCYRLIKNNWKIIHVPSSRIIHVRGASFENKKINKNRYEQLIASKAMFCKKRLKFQESKFYMICEIIYSYNMKILWHFTSLFYPAGKKEKAKIKILIFNLFFNFWINEFNNLLKKSEN
jgi:GT2 family glycosyltransferase